jgi:hypothetical protein
LSLFLAACGAGGPAAADALILIPDSLRDRVSAFSAADGAIVDLNFIPDDGRLVFPMQAVGTPWGTILVIDAGNVVNVTDTGEVRLDDDAILEYGFDGQYIRTLVTGLQVTGGQVKGIGESFQGICVAGSTVYFTYSDSLCSGCSPAPMPGDQNAVWRIDADGTGLQVVCDAQSNPSLGVLRGITPIGLEPETFLLADSGGDDIEQLGADCAGSTWHDSNGANGINFPQQVIVLPSGTPTPFPDAAVVAAGFSSPAGLYVYDSSGLEIFPYSVPTSPRGVYPLDNGDWIYTGGTLVRAINPSSGEDRLIVNVLSPSGSMRWISRVEFAAPCPGDLDGSGTVDAGDIGTMLLLFGAGAGSPGDLDASGSVDAGDIGSLLLLFGACP